MARRKTGKRKFVETLNRKLEGASLKPEPLAKPFCHPGITEETAMKKQFLYILSCRDEPLIKVGLADSADKRFLALERDRFDLRESYMVQSTDESWIRTLEQNLKTFFSAEQRVSDKPVINGNTETFRSCALSKMIQMVEGFRTNFPCAEFGIRQDLSGVLPWADEK